MTAQPRKALRNEAEVSAQVVEAAAMLGITVGWWQALRLFGWLWMPMQWVWRGCFDWDAARECLRQGWKEYRTNRLAK